MIRLNFTKNIIAAKEKNIIARARAYKDYREVAGRDFSVFYHKSDLPLPLICVHVDTMRNNKLRMLSDGEIIVNAYGVLGADDRAGCAIALYLMRAGIKAHFGFFDFEETGGIGSQEYCAKHSADIETYVKALIGLDRHGSRDAATYRGTCAPMMDIVGQYGYKEAFGSFTDVANIEQVNGVGCVNLSVGFYHEHRTNEYLNINDMRYTASVLPEIIEKVTAIDTSANTVSNVTSYFGYGFAYPYNKSVQTIGGRKVGVLGGSRGKEKKSQDYYSKGTRSHYGGYYDDIDDDYDDFIDPYYSPRIHEMEDEPYVDMPIGLDEIPPNDPAEDAAPTGGSSLWDRALDKVRKNTKSKAMK